MRCRCLTVSDVPHAESGAGGGGGGGGRLTVARSHLRMSESAQEATRITGEPAVGAIAPTKNDPLLKQQQLLDSAAGARAEDHPT